jgi:hypothetical protein
MRVSKFTCVAFALVCGACTQTPQDDNGNTLPVYPTITACNQAGFYSVRTCASGAHVVTGKQKPSSFSYVTSAECLNAGYYSIKTCKTLMGVPEEKVRTHDRIIMIDGTVYRIPRPEAK